MTRLSAIRKRLEAATPGPWVYGNSHVLQVVQGDYIESERPYNPITGSMKGILRREDGELIAHAPQDLRDLLAVAESAKLLVSSDWAAADATKIWCPFCGRSTPQGSSAPIVHTVNCELFELQKILSRLDTEVEE